MYVHVALLIVCLHFRFLRLYLERTLLRLTIKFGYEFNMQLLTHHVLSLSQCEDTGTVMSKDCKSGYNTTSIRHKIINSLKVIAKSRKKSKLLFPNFSILFKMFQKLL